MVLTSRNCRNVTRLATLPARPILPFNTNNTEHTWGPRSCYISARAHGYLTLLSADPSSPISVMGGQAVVFAGYKLSEDALSAYATKHKIKSTGYSYTLVLASLSAQIGLPVAVVTCECDEEDHATWLCVYAQECTAISYDAEEIALVEIPPAFVERVPRIFALSDDRVRKMFAGAGTIYCYDKKGFPTSLPVRFCVNRVLPRTDTPW